MKVQEALGDRVGRDVFIYSISLDPETDTPEVLARYAKRYGTGPGWTFYTGELEAIDALRHKLGAYDPDPIVDADKTQHSGILVFGNEPKGRWCGLPAGMKTASLARYIERLMRL